MTRRSWKQCSSDDKRIHKITLVQRISAHPVQSPAARIFALPCVTILCRHGYIKANSTIVWRTRFLIQTTKMTCRETKMRPNTTSTMTSLVWARCRPQSAAIWGIMACQMQTNTSIVIDIIMYTSYNDKHNKTATGRRYLWFSCLRHPTVSAKDCPCAAAEWRRVPCSLREFPKVTADPVHGSVGWAAWVLLRGNIEPCCRATRPLRLIPIDTKQVIL